MTENESQVINHDFAVFNRTPILKLYSIYDKQLKKFLPPFFAVSDKDAIRQLSSIVNYSDTLICRFAEDYCLYKVGLFDESDGFVCSIYRTGSKGIDDFSIEKVSECIDLRTEEGLRLAEICKRVEDDRAQVAAIVSDYHKCLSLIEEYEKKVIAVDGLLNKTTSRLTSLDKSKKSILDKLFRSK